METGRVRGYFVLALFNLAADRLVMNVNRARDHQHAKGLEGAGGDAGADVAGLVDDVGETLEILHGPVGFQGQSKSRRLGDDEMGFHLGVPKRFQKSVGVGHARRAADADDEALRGSHLDFFPRAAIRRCRTNPSGGSLRDSRPSLSWGSI
jgi:hypothetical protein